MAFNKEKVMDAARKFVDKNQLDKAIKEYLRVVKEDPQDVRVWLKIGDLHARKGQKQEATETYLKVARYYQDQGFFTKAVAVYKQILKLDPRLVEVHLKLAELYRQLGLMSDAMQHFESVAAHFHREGKTKEALATVRQLVDLDPQNVATRIKLAELYSKESMTDEAVGEFTLVCEQLRRQNRQDDFLKVAERLLWHRPDNRDLNRELAGLYLRRNDPRRALQKLQLCFKADPRDVETLALLAQAFQALDQKGKTVSVLKELARVFDESKQRARAEDVYRKILAFSPADPDAMAYLGGQAGAAVVAAPPTAIEQAKAPAAKLNWTGDVPALRPPGDPRMTGAMPLVDERSLGSDFALPDDSAVDEVAVVSDANSAIEPYEDSGIGRAGRGPADFAADFDEGSSHRAASVAGEEHAEEIAKILTETDVYVKYGLHQKAIEHLRRVFALDPDNVEARERLKDVLLSQGREAEAIAELLRLAENTAPVDAPRAEGYVREVLAVDGANQAALELTRRFGLDISIAPDVEIVDGGNDLIIDPDELASGGVAPVEEDIDFDDLDFGDPSRPRFDNLPRADSFDGIDPAMFDRAPSRPGSGAAGRAGSPRAVGSEHDFASNDATRQVAASEVQALVARSTRDGDVAMGSPPPFRAPAPRSNPPGAAPGSGKGPAAIAGGGPDTWQQRRLSDALDAELDDALADDIDQGVAAELSARAGFGDVAAATADYDATVGDAAMPPGEDDELPFDPAAAREFDAVMRRHGDGETYESSAGPTFDPGAAAAFDSDRDAYGGNVTTSPAPAQVGAQVLPADDLGDLGGAGYSTSEDELPSETYDAYGNPVYAEPSGYAYDQGGTIDQPIEAFAAHGDPAAAPRTLEDDLDDADYYLQHEMYEEALEVLQALQARHPHHPLIAARLRDLQVTLGLAAPELSDDELVQPASGGTETVDVEDLEELDPEEAAVDDDDDVAAAFDEAQRIVAGRHDDHHASSRPSVVLEKPVEDSDGDTHFDLGLAYKEMGLYDEAIKAFEKVAHSSPGREVQSRMMVGLCQREQGNLSEAVHQFKAGLHAGSINDRERQTLLYEIGATYEALNDPRESVYYFEMVVKRDPSFLDANDRLNRLRGGRGRRGGLDDAGDAIDSLLADDV